MKNTLFVFFLIVVLFFSTAETSCNNDTSGSGGTSDESSQNSSEESSQNSSDNSSDSTDGWVIAGLIITAGAVIYFGIRATTSSFNSDSDRSRVRLTRFLQRNHTVVKKSIALAGGRMLQDWGSGLGMTSDEMRKVQRALEGSPEQKEMLRILNQKITPAEAVGFSRQLVRVIRKTVGEKRFAAIVRHSLKRVKMYTPDTIRITGS